MGFGNVVGGILTLNTSTGIKVSNYLSRAIEEMISAFKDLSQARRLVNSCTCGTERDFYKKRESELVSKCNDLVDKLKDLKGIYDKLFEEHKKNVADYNELITNSKVLVERTENLQSKYDDLVDR